MSTESMIKEALNEIPDGLRTERVFAACRIWYQQKGTLPTLAKLRELVGKGSYTDLGRDLKAFAATIEAQTERAIKQPGMPEELATQLNEVVKQLWVATAEKAEERFEADRQAMQTQLDQVTGQNEILAAERLQALQERSQAFEDLAAEKRKVAEMEAVLREANRKVSDLEAKLSDAVKAKEAETTRLQGELVAANRLIDAKDVSVAQLREQSAGLQEQVRAERELADGFRIKAGNAETLLATISARADQAERDNASLKELVVSRDRRIAKLEADLVSNDEHYREKLSASETAAATLRGQLDELRLALKKTQDASTALVARNRSRSGEITGHVDAKYAAAPKR